MKLQRKFRLSTVFVWFWALAMVLVWAGCSPNFETEKCTTNQDCFPDEICLEGICRLDDGIIEDVGPDTTEPDAPEEADPVVARIELTPASGTVAVGLSIPFQAKGYTEDGDLVDGAVFLWSTKNNSIAEVSNRGEVTGKQVGETQVVAAWAEDTSVIGEADVTVILGDVDRVVVESEAGETEETVNVTDEVQFFARAYTEGNVELDDFEVIWTVENVDEEGDDNEDPVAEVDEEGVVTALRVGVAEVIANVEGTEGRARLIVENTPPIAKAGSNQEVRVGETVNLSAAGSVDLEDEFDELTFEWAFVEGEDPSEGDDEIVDDEERTGEASFVPTVVGEYEVELTVTDTDGLWDTARVTITVVPAQDRITVNYDEVPLIAGEEFDDLVATLTDGFGEEVEDAEFTWSINQEEIAEIDVDADTGVVTITAVADGETKLWVSVEGSDATPVDVTITVTWGDVDELTVEPEEPEIKVGDDPLQLVATAKNEFGVDITEYVDLDWEIIDGEDKVDLDDEGLVTAKEEGEATIEVSVDGKTVQAVITVKSADSVVDEFTVSPDALNEILGATGTITAVVKDQYGDPIEGVRFESDNTGVIEIDAESGAWEAVGVGEDVTITVSVDGYPEDSKEVEVTVEAGDVESVEMDTTPVQIEEGEQLVPTLTFVAKNAEGADITSFVEEENVEWISSDSTVASVDGGDVEGVSEGVANIHVEVEGVSSPSVEVTVVAPAPTPTTVEFTQDSLDELDEVILGDEGTLSAVVLDEDGGPIPGVAVSFSSDNTGVIEIDAASGAWEAVGVGEDVTITVSVDGYPAIVDDVTVTVNAPAPIPSSVKFTQDSLDELDEVILGDEGTLSANVLDEDGDPIPGVALSFSSDNTGVITIGETSGKWEAVGVGVDVTITVSVDGYPGIVDDVTVTVEAPAPTPTTVEFTQDSLDELDEVILGDDGTLSAVVLDEDGDPIPGVAVIFSSDNTGVIEIDAASGAWEAVGVGAATITVSVDGYPGIVDDATVMVEAGDIFSMEFGAATALVGVDMIRTLELNVRNQRGVDIGRYVIAGADWNSSNEGAATVDSDGVVTGHTAEESTTITVDIDGETASINIDVLESALETFSNFNTGGSYQDGQFTGDLGFDWEYGQAMTTNEHFIDGSSMILNSKRKEGDSFLKAEEIEGGISSFNVEYKRAYTNNSARQFEVLVNDQSVGLSPVFGNQGDDPTVYTFSVDNLDTTGPFSLEIRAVGGQQFVIDNIRWTPYEEP